MKKKKQKKKRRSNEKWKILRKPNINEDVIRCKAGMRMR